MTIAKTKSIVILVYYEKRKRFMNFYVPFGTALFQLSSNLSIKCHYYCVIVDDHGDSKRPTWPNQSRHPFE